LHADVVVGGAGAAGLMAALCAARRGRRVVVLEKSARPGLKILISGGGRCNLTTTRAGRDLEAQYGERRGRWLRHGLRAFPPPALRALFEGAGVALQEEDLEKVFPVSGRAGDVLDALLALVQQAGAELRTATPIEAVERAPGGFAVRAGGELWHAASVVLATGGLSYPRTGTTGDGYRLAAALGHGLVAPVPHLAPLEVREPWVAELAGVTLRDCALAALASDGRVLCERARPILFTHKGLSGPAAMDLAGCVEEHGGCRVRFDFAPDRRAEQIAAALADAARANGRRRVEHALPEHLPARLRETLVALSGAGGTLAELRRDARRRLVAMLKALTVPVARSLGFAHAEVTRGGIPLDEVDARTMRSKIVPGLYLCGEVLDVDGPIGGFNFQAAFATGRLAGLDA
jgi:hypothetical protein